MARKIYDVVPPKVASKVEDTFKSLTTKAPRKKKVVKEVKTTAKKAAPVLASPKTVQKPAQKKRRFPLRELVGGLVVILLLVGIYLYNALPKATVEISPTLDPITLNSKITADKSVTQLDVSRKMIPLRIVEEIKEDSQEFPATGTTSNDGKATGTITIYNKLSPSTKLTLIAGTHFLSDSGKYFVTLAKVTIPGMQGKTPGSVKVDVQATEVGSDYNIGPSKFSVPKLSGTAYYYGIWAESTEPMTGGYVGKVKKVTRDDLDSAEEVFTKKLLDSAETALRQKLTDEDVLLEGAIDKTVVSASASQRSNAIADNFVESAKVKVRASIVKKSDLQAFAQKTIESQLQDGKKILEGSMLLQYVADSVDFTHSIEKISLQGSAKAYSDEDFTSVTTSLRGKNSAEIQDTIKKTYGTAVSAVKISYWPFWVKKAPKNQSRITLNLNFGQ